LRISVRIITFVTTIIDRKPVATSSGTMNNVGFNIHNYKVSVLTNLLNPHAFDVLEYIKTILQKVSQSLFEKELAKSFIKRRLSQTK